MKYICVIYIHIYLAKIPIQDYKDLSVSLDSNNLTPVKQCFTLHVVSIQAKVSLCPLGISEFPAT